MICIVYYTIYTYLWTLNCSSKHLFNTSIRPLVLLDSLPLNSSISNLQGAQFGFWVDQSPQSPGSSSWFDCRCWPQWWRCPFFHLPNLSRQSDRCWGHFDQWHQSQLSEVHRAILLYEARGVGWSQFLVKILSQSKQIQFWSFFQRQSVWSGVMYRI